MSQAGLQQQKQLIAALLDPALYPHQAKTVRLIETHISWVLLAGRYAYKIKKALDLGFLDATTLKSRYRYCAEELRLNSRLAPQLYLGVVAIGGSHSRPEWDAQPAIEYAVKMRRFASTKTLDRLVTRDAVDARHMDTLATTLAHFHTQLPATTTDTADIHHALVQNFSQLAGLLPATDTVNLAALKQSGEHAFRTSLPNLQARCTRGFIRECHGDLHLGNIVLIKNQPTPFDGIDFNPALRRIDVMDEVAFLFMDLLHHQRPDLAYRFLNTYLELTGDYAGVELLNFYCAYRATVRAKVNAIRANQTNTSPPPHSGKEPLDAMATCRDYLQLAGEFLTPQHPHLIITHGLPGSGKSTFAQTALERMGAIRLRSDVERKRLFGLSALEESRTDQDIYSADATQRTYAHLLTTARTLLIAGHTVIVDAAFLKQKEREMFRKLAAEIGAAFAIASMQEDNATLRSRILKRQALSNDASEANLNVLKKLLAAQEPLLTQERGYTAIFSDSIDNQSSWATLEKVLCE